MTRGCRALVALAGTLAVGAACDRLATNLSGGAAPASGILRGKLPSETDHVTHAVRLTDGIAATPGDPARTDLTAEIEPRGHVTWDLGAEVPVRCALIDADGRRDFKLSISKDGAAFEDLWTAGLDEDWGQQLRAGRDLRGVGRYLRLQGVAGQGTASVSEISAWRDCPTSWPPLAMQKGTPDDEAVRFKLWAFAALAVSYVLAYRRRGPDWVKLMGVAPAGIGLALVAQLVELWPPSRALLAQLVVVGAAIVAALALRWIVGRARVAPTAPPND